LLEAIETAAEAGPEAPDFFHVLDVLQMCCLSGRSGAVQIVKQTRSGIVYDIDLHDENGQHCMFFIAPRDEVGLIPVLA
jgi:hypothetical protein